MRILEGVVRRVDTPAWHAVYRLMMGSSLLPLFGWWSDSGHADWRLVPFFLVMLLMLRLVPAVVRHLVPFPADACARWSHRRLLAKHFDSYQWRKLLWFGLGLAASMVFFRRAEGATTLLVVACLVGGGLGAWRWRCIASSEQVAAVLSRRGHGSGPAC
jgi:hypothetical protein